MMACALSVVVCCGLHANPIPIPGLLMPEEFIDVRIVDGPDGLRAIVDGRYPFVNREHLEVTMLYPVAPDSTDIGVWMDNLPLAWDWSHETYPTILPEWPELPMIQWDISPVPPEFTITAHYEHDVVRRPDEWVYLYPMGTGKYFDTFAEETVAHVSVGLPNPVLPKGVFRDHDPVPFCLHSSPDAPGWALRTEIRSRPFEPLLEDFILPLMERWTDPLAWFSQPPDMADGPDIWSSEEVAGSGAADDFAVEPTGVIPPNVGTVRWWGSFPGWEADNPHPDDTAHQPRPAYFRVRIHADAADPASGVAHGPGEILHREQIDDFEQTYFGAVVREVRDGSAETAGPVYEYEHKFEYRADLARPFTPLPGQRYWLSIVAGPVACEWAWGWATSPVEWGEPASIPPTPGAEELAAQRAVSAQTLAPLDAPLIFCEGTESGGDGPRRYAYRVDSGSYPMMEFRVGTSDLDAGRYMNVLIPEGWRFAVEERPMTHYCEHKTPHGRVSDGPCRCLTAGSVRWWTEDPALAVEFFTFGFDHPWSSEDVSWVLFTEREGPPPQEYAFDAEWDAPVGTGMGPVHGPASEPRLDMAFVLSSRRPEVHPAGKYCLMRGSTLTEFDATGADDPVVVPIHGRFYLDPMSLDAADARFAVRDLEFGSDGISQAYVGEAEGIYEHSAALERMEIEARINNVTGLVFDSGVVPPQAAFPWIEIDLPQVLDNPTDPPRRFHLHLVAAPCPQVWFSTEHGFTPADATGGGHAHVSDGDLVNSVGQVVQTNRQLTSRLGIMPIPPDIGLDAVLGPIPAPLSSTCCPRPEVWFSAEDDVHSETLGRLHHGHLLSNAGRIVRTYFDLIAPFSPMPPIPDYGLDAVTRGPDGILLFSVEEGFFSENLGVYIGHGDLLAENGRVVRTNAELMAKFEPIGPEPIPEDFGLDAVFVWPHGEVWFSTEASFHDARLGHVGDGDLLSDTGRVVRQNRELMAPFSPLEDLADFGLDGLEVVTPILIHIAGGVGAMGDPTAFISPRSKLIGLDSVDILVSEQVGLIGAHTRSTGGSPPEVVSLTPLNNVGLHRVQFSGPIELAEWTNVELSVVGAFGMQTDLCFQVAHLPDDCDGNGQVSLGDATRFGQLYRAGRPVLQADLDGNGQINLVDATLFGLIWRGEGGESHPDGGGWLGKGLPPKPPCACDPTE